MTRQFAPRFPLWRTALTVAATVLLCTPVFGDDDRYSARPISDAEKAAVEAVLAFFETGPNAILTRLSSDAPWRQLDSGRALDEIAVRFGPAENSEWYLRTPGRNFDDREDVAIFSVEFASGLEDVLFLTLREEAGDWLIQEIRCGVDPRASSLSLEDELNDLIRRAEETAVAVPPGNGSQPGSPPGSQPGPTAPPLLWLGLVGLAGLACLCSAGLSLGAGPIRRRRAIAVGGLCAALVVTGCHLLPGGEEEAQEEVLVEPDPVLLADLLPLRRLLTGGRSSGAAESDGYREQVKSMVQELTGDLADDDPIHLAARAWQAQALFLDGVVAGAEKVLRTIPEPDLMPVVALMRAELAALDGNTRGAMLYDRARRLGPDHDGLAYEAALVSMLLGENERAEENIRSLVWMNSRDAESYYLAAKLEAIDDKVEKAEKLLAVGWELEPVSRSELFSNPILSILAIRPNLFPIFEFGQLNEPAIAPRKKASRPLEISETASSKILGQHLVIDLGDRVLHVQGGGDLMPEWSEVESAASRRKRLAELAMGRIAELKADLEDGGQLRPSRRRSITTAAANLMQQERWDEIIDLTKDLSSDFGQTPAELIRYRALALLRANRETEGTNLVIELARNDLENRRRDPTTYFLLGEMLAGLGQYDLAIRCMERAAKMTKVDFTERRRMQLEMIQELEEDKSIYESRRFRMVYPKRYGEKYPKQLSWVLEAEWDRIRQWIPLPNNSPKIEVHLYPSGDFLRAYAGEGGVALGIYDGVVRMPLADLKSMSPEIIRIVSHELAHAMIDLATQDRAPHWFHEGLAGHTEMNQRAVNPMPDLHKAGRDLSIGLLEDVFRGKSEPQLVSLAYTNAAWTLHYIETRKGKKGIHQMLSAYRGGHDTAGALRKAFGQSFEDFDRDVRQWAIHEAPKTWESELVPYHELFDEMLARDNMDLRSPMEVDRLLEKQRSHRAVSAAEMPRRMREWHSAYTSAVRPVKVQLGQAMPLLQGKKKGDVQAACSSLKSSLDTLLRQRTALAAPEPTVARNLDEAYKAFRHMSQHCRAARWDNMRSEMHRAVHYLGEAKKGMQPFGIAP